jgi:hypothetical protein
MLKYVKVVKGNQLQVSLRFRGSYPEVYDMLWALQDYEKTYYTVSGNAVRRYQWIERAGYPGKTLSWITLDKDFPKLRDYAKAL